MCAIVRRADRGGGGTAEREVVEVVGDAVDENWDLYENAEGR